MVFSIIFYIFARDCSLTSNPNFIMNEIWKDIPHYEGLYQVSNMGRVKSLNYRKTGKEHIMKPIKHNRGYRQIVLYKKGIIKHYLIHRLVWETFKGKIPAGLEVNHLDEDKTNNCLDNLELLTRKENNNYGTHNERVAATKKGVYNTAKSKPVEAYDDKGNIILTFPSTREAGRNGFNNGHISNCCRGKCNTHRGLHWRYVK